MILMYSSLVSAGFPHTVTSDVDEALDLNSLVIKHPISTYFVRVDGDSMIDAQVKNGDILVVDRSREIKSGEIGIFCLNGKACVKRYQKEKDGIVLRPENGKYSPISVSEEDEFEVWGVVTYVVHKT